MENEFVHLHLHTQYSLNDGMIKAKDLALKLKELGMNKVAITQHGNMFNMPEEYKILQDEGIELIVGMEAYIVNDYTSKSTKEDRANNHLVLLCENNEGYKNLKTLATKAALHGFYYKPRIDKKLLRKYHKGLIGSSACLGGTVNTFLLNGEYEKAKAEALEYLDIFGEGNFFLEIQRHGLEDQEKINPLILKLSRETGIPLIATNDCHYTNKEDWEAHDILMAIQAKTTIYDTKRKVYGSHEFYVKSPQEMKMLFSDIPEAISNTVKIANRCHVELEFGTNKIPHFDVPKDYFDGTSEEFLRYLVIKGAKERYECPLSSEVMERIDFELDVINRMGYTDYFLINWDFFRFCREGSYDLRSGKLPEWEPILTGPGRGSAAGSIVAYCLDITKLDPIHYNLLFERFLGLERVTMPDVDSDFQTNRRQEVIDYVINRYGRDCISQVITFGTLAARAVIRSIGRATDAPYELYDKVAKMIPKEVNITIEKALKANPDLKTLYDTNVDVAKLLDAGMKLEGLATTTSTHAAAVLITDKSGVAANTPMWENKVGIVTQYGKDLLEDLGLLKMDFLALITLQVISEAKKFIKINHGIDVDLNELYKCEDLKPLELIRNGNTVGIFQLESAGMSSFMKELKPESIEDIIAGIALYRPGPMDEIPRFLANKRNPSKIHYDIEGLDKILDETYGVIVYQGATCFHI